MKCEKKRIFPTNITNIMEQEVSSNVPKDGGQTNKEFLLSGEYCTLEKSQHNESSLPATTEDSNTIVDTQDTINKSTVAAAAGGGGASPKLQIMNSPENEEEEEDDDEETTNATNGGVTDDTPNDCMYFYEDEVFRIDKKGRVKFGFILETTADQDEEFDELLAKGEVRVVWFPDGDDRVHAENSVRFSSQGWNSFYSIRGKLFIFLGSFWKCNGVNSYAICICTQKDNCK